MPSMTADAGFVSVIISFLNAERFLEEAIASVRSQEYPHWELLLVDDGSTDRSSEIARAWAQSEPHRVRYFQHPSHANLGLSASRNLGLRAACGEYVAFLDADDVWLPQRLRRGVAILRANPGIAMVYGRTLYWHSWDEDATRRDRVQPHWFSAGSTVEAPELLIRYLEYRAALPPPTSLLVRRAACRNVGGFDESFRLMHEDQVFLAKICLGCAVYVSNECWDKYRQHRDSACARAECADQTAEAERRYIDWLRCYLQQHGHARGRVWDALQRRATRRPSALRRLRMLWPA